GEHARRVQARADRERAAGEAGGPSALGDPAHRRRVRDPAADREAVARAGPLLLPVWLHGQARRHRDRRDGAAADVLDLLRPAVPAAAARGVRAHARREARRARLDRVAREHRLDRRAVRRWRADADPGDAHDAARSAERRPRRRRLPHRRHVRLPGAVARPGRRQPSARPARDVERRGAVRRQGTRARRSVHRELLEALRRRGSRDSRRRPEALMPKAPKAPKAPWRVAIITSVPAVAADYVERVRGLGHEPVVAIAARPGVDVNAFVEGTEGLDVVVPASRHALASILKAYTADLALCGGYPWRVPQEAIDAVRLGIVNAHIGMLPRYRGPYPVAWAIRNGETEAGLSYHFMDADFDTG